MSDSKLIIRLDIAGSRNHFMRSLQHQLDVISLLIGGAQKVTPEQINDARGFLNFSPAHGSELTHEETRNKAIDWLNCCFLRDAIEGTDLFLGRCLSFCSSIKRISEAGANAIDFGDIFKTAPIKHQKLHFPAKLLALESYGLKPEFSDHVLSINKIRTCLVHRLGKVSALDSQDGEKLTGRWVSCQMVLRGIETGTEIILNGDDTALDEQGVLEMRLIEHKREFLIGEHISLSPYETYSTIFTLWQFGMQCDHAIEDYAIRSGIPVTKN